MLLFLGLSCKPPPYGMKSNLARVGLKRCNKSTCEEPDITQKQHLSKCWTMMETNAFKRQAVFNGAGRCCQCLLVPPSRPCRGFSGSVSQVGTKTQFNLENKFSGFPNEHNKPSQRSLTGLCNWPPCLPLGIPFSMENQVCPEDCCIHSQVLGTNNNFFPLHQIRPISDSVDTWLFCLVFQVWSPIGATAEHHVANHLPFCKGPSCVRTMEQLSWMFYAQMRRILD